MKIPVIRGLIERRILINYRVDPQVLAAQLPAPFRPKLVHGFGMAGICLIRLAQVRPRRLPAWLGFSSENAAHRVAVEWDEAGVTRQGVYVRRRDSNSRFNAFVGGRLFPGFHHHARFTIDEAAEHWNVALQSDDGATSVAVRTHRAERLPATSIFETLAAASAFFAAGSLGYSDTPTPGRYQGLELNCQQWQVEPLAVDEVRSSYFDDESRFPRGSIEFDNALLMRGIEHEWHEHANLCCAQPV